MIKLTEEDWKIILDAIKNPPPPTQRLIEAKERYNKLIEE